MDRTTNLTLLRRGTPYTWGQVIAIHEIGPYTIVESHPWLEQDGRIRTGVPDPTSIEFHTYVNGLCCSHSYPTLDEALAGCMAYRAEGPNHHADTYFIRSLRRD